MFGCGDSLFNAWISLKLFTYTHTQSRNIWGQEVDSYLFYVVKMCFHAFDGDEFVGFDGLGFEDL